MHVVIELISSSQVPLLNPSCTFPFTIMHLVFLSCAISAAFAATSTSLICIFVLSNTSSGGSLLGYKNKFFGTSPLVKIEAEISAGSNSGDVHDAKRHLISSGKREKELEIVGEKADVSGSGFNPSKELDFAIIGWPKTGKDKVSLWFSCLAGDSMPHLCFFVLF